MNHPFWYPTLWLLQVNAYAAKRWRAHQSVAWYTVWALTRPPAVAAYHAYRWMRSSG